MNLKKTLLSVVTTYVIFQLTPLQAAPVPAFTPEQEAQIGKIAADYLVAHPEVLVQVSQKLQQQQQERWQRAFALKVLANQDALLNDKDTPETGPARAEVAVIEFFDYQCVYCSRLAPGMETVMKASPDVRFIFREWPIFGARWKTSEQAALRGIDIWKQKGGEAYLTYHNAIFRTGHNEGQLTEQDIGAAAKAAGITAERTADYSSPLARTDQLAQSLGLTGTPGLIVMPVRGATAENITVFTGLASPAQIFKAIEKARR